MGRKRRRQVSGPQAARPVLRPELPVDEEVDLHGLAVDEALVEADLALRRYAGRAGVILRFVHGHSSGLTGSIKGALRRNLETIWKARIQSFLPEPGNPGATLVKLGQSLKGR